MSISAYAHSENTLETGTDNTYMRLTEESFKSAINRINHDYPEAKIDITEALECALLLSKMSAYEQKEYISELKEHGVARVYKNENGTLVVYSPAVIESCVLYEGTKTTINGITYYTGSTVSVTNLRGLALVNAQYSVNHNRNSSYVGNVTSVSSFTGNGNGLITLGSWYYDQTSGSQAIVRVEIWDSGASSGYPTYIADCSITFNASTFQISTAWI